MISIVLTYHQLHRPYTLHGTTASLLSHLDYVTRTLTVCGMVWEKSPEFDCKKEIILFKKEKERQNSISIMGEGIDIWVFT